MRYGTENVSYGFRASLNSITRLGDQRARISPTFLGSLDAVVNYNLPLTLKVGSVKMNTFIEGGTGYTWFGKERSHTLNGGYGVNIPVSEKMSIKINTTYKHAFNDMQALKAHFQHNVGVAINFGGKDSDRDGVYDQYDDCPNTAGLPAFNGCPDNDGDGIENSKDSCPDVAGLAQFDGCPDSDGDGVPDTKDACVNEAGSVEMNGCPDSDGDSVADNVDNCADVAGPADNNGCPWPDSDSDGVLDKDDKCPNAAGLSAYNGCPIPAKEVMAQLNSVGAMIPFELNRAELGSKVKGMLGDVIGIMNNYPKIPFMIEGHTDSSGPKAFNQKLSELRAMSVKEYLVENGITSSRLMTVGYGEDKPNVSNNTRKGRIQNRRVEFKVIPPPSK
jgi:outer membrane protein OmpA-like peptidoglycan-associated protein